MVGEVDVLIMKTGIGVGGVDKDMSGMYRWRSSPFQAAGRMNECWPWFIGRRI